MQITWNGGSSFTISAKGVSVVTDPPGRATDADIVTLSDASRRGQLAAKGDVVDWPGEYEMKGTFIIGIPSSDTPSSDTPGADTSAAEAPAPRTLFALEVEGISIGHFAGLAGKLSVEQIEQLGDIDVLLLHVGAGGLDPANAKLVVEQIDPRVLIPMGDDPAVRQALLAQMGVEPEQVEGTLKIESRDLPQESTRLVFFSSPA